MAKKVLVKMIKEGEEPIEVSPLVVENHKQLGWKVAGPDGEPAAEAEKPAGEQKKAEGRRRKRGGRAAAKAPEAPAEDSE